MAETGADGGVRVLYDGLIYASQRAGGINRYVASVADRLPPDVHGTLVVPRRTRVNFPQSGALEVVEVGDLGRPYTRRGRQQARALRQRYATMAPDVIHPTYYDTLARLDLRRAPAPTVITVHDLIHRRFRRQLDRAGLHARSMRRAVEGAAAIVCISQNTRRDLLEWLPGVEGRIHVIPQASSLDPSLARDLPRARTRPFFLYVGSRAFYKDVDVLLRAFREVRAAHADVDLVFVGAPFNAAEQARLRELGIDGSTVEAGHVDDAAVVALYRDSLALVYPSAYEGFGIPPLEAMTCGTAAITSNASSLPEVVGGAALTFPPGEVAALAAHMQSVIDDSGLRADLVERGAAQARRFSWDETARRTVEVYRSLA